MNSESKLGKMKRAGDYDDISEALDHLATVFTPTSTSMGVTPPTTCSCMTKEKTKLLSQYLSMWEADSRFSGCPSGPKLGDNHVYCRAIDKRS